MNHNLHIDNRTLVEECKRGDKEALNLFYIRFAPRMLSVICRYVSDRKDAEDILHDGFIVALTRLESLRDFEKVDYWLATIMKNLSLQFLNNQDVANVLHEIPEVEDTPEIEDIIDLDTLESLIRKLPEGYQKVFRLAVLENKSHKEIAKLLGIAPNSSSSQLFHAKLMMRKLIVEYRRQAGLLTLLLVVATAGTLLWFGRKGDKSETQLLIAENEIEENVDKANADSEDAEVLPSSGNTGVSPNTPTSSGSVSPKQIISVPVVVTVDSIREKEPQHVVTSENHALIADNIGQSEETKSEGIDAERTDSMPATTYEPYYAYLDEDVIKKYKGDGWSFSFGVNPGILNFNSFGNDDSLMNDFSSSNGGILGGDDLEENPDDDKNKGDSETKGLSTRGENSQSYKDYHDTRHHNSLPVSFSLSANKRLSELVSIESGLKYTYLHTTFESYYSRSHCHWHYIGIPLKLNLKTFSTDRLRLYASFGGEVDFPVYSNADVTSDSNIIELRPGRFSSPVVWSLSACYGVSYKLSGKVEIFLEPTLQYHFKNNYEVPNIWTDNPWGFSLPIGLRFNW